MIQNAYGYFKLIRLISGLLLLIASLFPPELNATEYFVSVKGNDSDSGTLEKPFRTISAGLDKLNPGDILYIRGGTYNEVVKFGRSGTPAQKITISGYPGEKVLIDGNNSLPGTKWGFLVSISGDHVVIKDLEIVNSLDAGLILSGNYSSAVGIKMSHIGETGMVMAGSNNLFDGCSCTGNGYGYGGRYSTWGSAICSVGKNNIIQNCTAWDNRGEGINSYAGATGTIIRNNVSYNNRSVQLYLDSTSDCQVYGNLVYCTDGRANGIVIGAETGQPHDLAVYNNMAMGNFTNFQIDSNVSRLLNILIYHNTFINAIGDSGSGYNMGVYFRPTVSEYSGSAFVNNLVIENAVSSRIPVYVANSHPGLLFSNNFWNEVPVSGAQGNGDVTGNPFLTGSGSTKAGELTPAFFMIESKSPAINKGAQLNAVKYDFFGNERDSSPDIGAHEYMTSSAPVKVTSIEVTGAGGATAVTIKGGKLQMVASVLPANATVKTVTWSVQNNTGQATISTDGLLTAVADGYVTVKASANDDSGVSGIIKISISGQTPPPKPVYVSSVVENNNPSRLEILFSLPLANVNIPVTAFQVTVNSELRSVETAVVSGSKVILTLSNPVKYGNKLTVAYTKPDVNPVKSESGGEADSFGPQSTVNNVMPVNNSPVPVIKYNNENYSGFTGEIDASESYDPNGDKISFLWTTTDNIPVSSTSSEVIRFLSPIVNEPVTYTFSLKISDGKISSTIQLPLTIIPYKPELEIAEILEAKASSYIYPDFPHNSFDNNLSTKWSVTEDNQWLELYLANPFRIDHVKLAFSNDQPFSSVFDIYASEDNVTWDPILIKSNSCTFSGDLQVFEFPESKTEKVYSFVKLVSRQSKTSARNSIAEFKIYGTPERRRTNDLLLIYPNPVKNNFRVSLKNLSVHPDYIRIANLTGETVYRRRIEEYQDELDIQADMKNGIYLVQIISGGLIVTGGTFVVSK